MACTATRVAAYNQGQNRIPGDEKWRRVCKSARLRPDRRIVIALEIRQGYKDDEYIELSLLEAGGIEPQIHYIRT